MLGVKMDIELITPDFTKRHLKAFAIHIEINDILGEGTVGYSTVTQYLRKRSFADSSETLPEQPETKKSDSIDNVILQALDQQPFASQSFSMTMTLKYPLIQGVPQNFGMA
jgi:hypothetical protein